MEIEKIVPGDADFFSRAKKSREAVLYRASLPQILNPCKEIRREWLLRGADHEIVEHLGRPHSAILVEVFSELTDHAFTVPFFVTLHLEDGGEVGPVEIPVMASVSGDKMGYRAVAMGHRTGIPTHNISSVHMKTKGGEGTFVTCVSPINCTSPVLPGSRIPLFDVDYD